MKLQRGFIAIALTGLCGCTAAVNKASVQATEGAPVSAQVEILRIPYNPSHRTMW